MTSSLRSAALYAHAAVFVTIHMHVCVDYEHAFRGQHRIEQVSVSIHYGAYVCDTQLGICTEMAKILQGLIFR